MQTLPTPVSQTKAPSLADVVNQNGSHANKSSTENAKATFQAELNRQVGAKQGQAQAKQEKSAEPIKSQTQQKTSVKDQSDIDKTASSTSKNLNNGQSDDSFLTDLNSQLDAARDLSNKVVLDDTKDASQAAVAATAEGDGLAIADLIAALGIASAQSLQNDSKASVASEAGDALLATSYATVAQKNLMAALNSSITKGQPESKQAVDATLTADDVTAKPQDEGLTDVLAGRSEPKLAPEESAFNKTMLNVAAKDLPAKDAASNIIQAQAASAQTSSVNAVQNNSNLASQQLASGNIINVYPGKTGWDQAISQKVVWMVGAGQQSASLTLNPPDMGPLKVVINVHNDQADTTFISDNDEVRKALESGMSNLRDKMSESGIQLGQANVSTSQQSQQEFQQAAQNRVFQSAKSQTNTEVVERDTQAKVSVRVSDGLVDTFA